MGTIDWASADRDDLDAVADEVMDWARYAEDSPLYATLARGIAEDRALLAVVAAIRGVPPLNLLFGAVKATLTGADALAAWYPHLTDTPRSADAAAVAAFRDHVLARADALVALASSRRTQTNETGRAAVLLPWIPAGVPVHAIDLGASAGLNLCLDRFSYAYTGDAAVSLGSGAPRLECEVRGAVPVPAELPTFASRTGIDLSPVDANDPEQAAWLEALVWPEHGARLDRLRAAIRARESVDVSMIAGDAATAVADVVATLPPGPLVVWHTVALYQADDATRADVDAAVEEATRHRDVTRIAVEPVAESPDPVVRIGPRFDEAPTVAYANAHGRWIRAVG